jgi:hypothetical protein
MPGPPGHSQPEPSGRRERTSSEQLWAKIRGTIFLTYSMTIAIPLFLCMLAIYPLVWVFDRHRRRAEHIMNKVWAWCSVAPFNRVKVGPALALNEAF